MLLLIICILLYRRYRNPSVPDNINLYNAISDATNNFSDRNIIGRGNASTVYRGFFENSDKAFKSFNNVISFQHEKHIFTVIGPHDTIINLISYENEHLILIIEYMIGGNLYNYIHMNLPIDRIEITKRLQISLDISNGIKHMHDNEILHKDINASNVLLNDERTSAKICDFELSRPIDHPDNQGFPRGHIGYFERDDYNYYTTTQDIYRLGVIFIELITNTHANRHDPIRRELPNYVLNNGNIQQGWPEDFLSIAESCCTNIIVNRPTANYLTQAIQNIIADMNQNA